MGAFVIGHWLLGVGLWEKQKKEKESV